MTDLERGQLLTERHVSRRAREVRGRFRSEDGCGGDPRAVAHHRPSRKKSRRCARSCRRPVRNRRIKKLSKRLKLMEAFTSSGNKPEWMVMKVLPVLPPEVEAARAAGRRSIRDIGSERPLSAGHQSQQSPSRGCSHSTRPTSSCATRSACCRKPWTPCSTTAGAARAITGANKRPLKSLADMIKGKQGRFRQNLLGKRVRLLGALGRGGRSDTEAASVRVAEEDGAGAVQAVRLRKAPASAVSPRQSRPRRGWSSERVPRSGTSWRR